MYSTGQCLKRPIAKSSKTLKAYISVTISDRPIIFFYSNNKFDLESQDQGHP